MIKCFDFPVNRDPNKRKIKPVESVLAFGAHLDDSEESDDSDYKPANLDDDDIEFESDGDESGNKNADEHDSTDKSGSESDDESDCDLLSDKQKPTDKAVLNGSCSSSSQQLTSSLISIKSSSELKHDYKKILICSVCLGDISKNEDEIVECDACGISVHEYCYGITQDDAESIHSDASSCSTEPWFCDPCKAGIQHPSCELCPNVGGIYKITDAGRWVHMVCALYIHGITFNDLERLRGPTLNNINWNNWGARACVLCEDKIFSRTGICISCDAGMCKIYFHVTCAQRQGFLFENFISEEVDPYIAYCKQHADRHVAKKKRKNYLALCAKNRVTQMSSSVGSYADQPASDQTLEANITNQRTLKKLHLQRTKFMLSYQTFGNQTHGNFF